MESKQMTLQSQTVQCPYCGEYYSVTYKYCPFCDEGRKQEERKHAARKKQAKSLFTGLFSGKEDADQTHAARETRSDRPSHSRPRHAQRSTHYQDAYSDESWDLAEQKALDTQDAWEIPVQEPAPRRSRAAERPAREQAQREHPRSEAPRKRAEYASSGSGFHRKKTSEMTPEEREAYRREREARAAARKRARDQAAALIEPPVPVESPGAEEVPGETPEAEVSSFSIPAPESDPMDAAIPGDPMDAAPAVDPMDQPADGEDAPAAPILDEGLTAEEPRSFRNPFRRKKKAPAEDDAAPEIQPIPDLNAPIFQPPEPQETQPEAPAGQTRPDAAQTTRPQKISQPDPFSSDPELDALLSEVKGLLDGSLTVQEMVEPKQEEFAEAELEAEEIIAAGTAQAETTQEEPSAPAAEEAEPASAEEEKAAEPAEEPVETTENPTEEPVEEPVEESVEPTEDPAVAAEEVVEKTAESPENAAETPEEAIEDSAESAEDSADATEEAEKVPETVEEADAGPGEEADAEPVEEAEELSEEERIARREKAFEEATLLWTKKEVIPQAAPAEEEKADVPQRPPRRKRQSDNGARTRQRDAAAQQQEPAEAGGSAPRPRRTAPQRQETAPKPRNKTRSKDEPEKKVSPLPFLIAIVAAVVVAVLLYRVVVPALHDRTAEPAVTTTEDTAATFSLNPTELTLTAEGMQDTLIPIFTPEGTTAQLEWHCDNWGSVDVDPYGVVTAKAPGVATVSATMANGEYAACVVTCTWEETAGEAPAEGQESAEEAAAAEPVTIALNMTSLTLSGEGQAQQLILEGASGAVKWTSDKTSVATVSADGTVTAISKGGATVTAESEGQKYKCDVVCVW